MPEHRNIQQHFVTAAYLVGFTPDSRRDSQLWVYERNSERVFRQIPDEAAKSRNYYSIPLESGGYNDIVDAMLTSLEGQAMPALQKVLDHATLTPDERIYLAYLIAFQEFRTPWARSSFQRMELALQTQMMKVAAQAPGYLESKLEELKAKGEIEGSTSADDLREALKNKRIKLVAQRHAGMDMMISMGQTSGDVYVQMQWTIYRSKDAEFVTSDTPVIRRGSAPNEGYFSGGLMNPTAEIWFPLSKRACLQLTHDFERMERLVQALGSGDIATAQAVRSELPSMTSSEIDAETVLAVNQQTIAGAERFVYSPFESEAIARTFKGECQNFRIQIS